MNTTQISPAIESHTEEPLWQELTEQEQENLSGGNWKKGGTQFRWGFAGLTVYRTWVYQGKNSCTYKLAPVSWEWVGYKPG